MKKMWYKKLPFKPLVFIGIALLLIVLAIISFNFVGKEDDTYTMLNKAIKKTEAQKTYVLQIDTAAEITIGDMVQRTETNGYITSLDEEDITHIYVNTASTTSNDSTKDFDVTVSMYTHEDKVYDNSSGSEQEVDMTVDEFNEIVDSYSLYKFNRKNVSDISFAPREAEGVGKCGELNVALITPEKNVLEAYSEKLTEITEEQVEPDDLRILNAMVTYSLFDDLVQSQTYAFTVEYVNQDDITVRYGVTSQVAYTDTTSISGDYDKYIPIQEKES